MVDPDAKAVVGRSVPDGRREGHSSSLGTVLVGVDMAVEAMLDATDVNTESVKLLGAAKARLDKNGKRS